MNWTKEQNDAIYKKDSNILVAAAAGSGKTAVLVERIIQKILTQNIDIDKLLVVTFTNAAASEMRERVLDAIYKKLDEDPDNEKLQRQIILLGKSNICTIHSFCLDVIKNNFFEIDLSANFRIGSEEEISLLKQDVLEDVFEDLYEVEDEDFAKLVDTYTGYRGDEPLKEIILNIHKFIQSSPFPNEWLEEKIEMFNVKNEYRDFSESIWGKILLNNLKDEITDSINSFKTVKLALDKFEELSKYSIVISDDINILQGLYNSLSSWDLSYEYAKDIKFKSWPVDKKISLDVKDESKKSRDSIKKKIMSLISKILIYNSEEAYGDIFGVYEILNILKNVINKFDIEFKKRKRERNIIDFNDIEHYALKILVKKDENGKKYPTEVAKKYQEKFEEIAIDEYQDSNEVQEFILSTISKGNNIFMVGDVKQSIYKFRQACPDLFLEKYDKYSLDGNEKGLKIQLFKNFRSKKNVLDITNTIFENIMSKSLGDIDYTEEEYLNLGAEYEEIDGEVGNAEIHIIDLEEKQIRDIWIDSDKEDEILLFENEEETDSLDERLIKIEKEEIEAKFVAKKIKELINKGYRIKDKKEGYRNIKYKDIVILLRSTSRLAPIYEKELLNNDIPVFSDASNEYLDTIEIQTIINLLKILDNPIDDISLVSVLRSEIGTFSDNEILEIRLCNKESSFYQSLIEAKEKLQGDLKHKVIDFLNHLDLWRTECDYLSLAEVIWKIYVDTGFYNYVGLMPNGTLRQANLKMLFERAKEYEKTSFKGLYNFISFIEKLKIENSDLSSAKIIGENEDVVRIMSIHKSKGLEFPVVFLSSTSKQMNMQDLNKNILLHQKIGIGPEYINYDRRIEYSTSAKEAIKIISKEELISEEMRILYVALTRAKEKLIITGTAKNYEKDIEKKRELLKTYNSNGKKINPILIKKYNTYLDWIELVLLNNNVNNLLTINIHNKEELIEKEEKQEIKIRDFDFGKETDFSEIEKIFSWKYKNTIETTLPIKSTVSKIKESKMDINEYENLKNKGIGIANIVPNFMKNEEIISSSKKGTLMHLFLQKLDLRKEYNLNNLELVKQNLIAKKFITDEEAKYINLNKIYYFLNSKLAISLRKSKLIEKEKPFCMKISAKEISNEAKDETLLVQGIIDLYFVDENDKLILVDYKTDFIENNDDSILIKKYSKQLEIYKNALEEALNKKVDKVYIYSLYLNKEIELLRE